MLFLVLLATCILLLLFKCATFGKNYWTKRGVVQVDGVLTTFFTQPYSVPEIYRNLYNKYSKDKYIGIFLPKPVIIVKDLEDIQAVFCADFSSFNSRGITTNPSDLLADNLLFMNDYKRWRLLRQKLSPVFTIRKLKNMFYIMNDCAQNFVQKIDSKGKNTCYDILYSYNTACITATIFSIDTTSSNTMNSLFLEMAQKSNGSTFKTNLKIFISNMAPELFKLLNIKLFSEFEKFFFGTVRKVIENRLNDSETKHDFIDTCIELQKLGKMIDQTTNYEMEPTLEVLAAQAFFFFLAGIDTSTTAMHFTLLELASNPSILSKLYKEIDQVFDKTNNNPTSEDIDKILYLDMVISEAMRKYPPIGAIQRLCTRDTTLPAGQITLKKGDIVVVPVFAIHRNEKYYPNPEIFDPERFSSDNIHKIIKFTYLPFGEGTRICLGNRFARLQMKAGLSWLLRKYTLKEQEYKPISFDKSFFAIRDSKADIELIPRENKFTFNMTREEPEA